MMKEKEMKRVPKLRFPEFTDDWEQRKYAEIIELLSGQDFNPEEYNEDGIGIPYLTGASCIVNGCTTAVRWTEKPRCIAEKGDTVLVCKGSGYGAIATVTQKKAHIARQFMALKVKKYELDNRFNYFLLNSVVENIKTDARGLIAGIARDAVLKQEIDIPCLNEQKKIGEYFSYLDHLITLHQRKLKNLNVLKKCVMQKLFSQKVRFKADDGSEFPKWKEKRLGDVFTERTERSKGGETLLSVTIAQGIVRQSETDKRNTASENKSNYKIVKRNDLAYNTMRMWQGAEGVSEYDGIVSPAYTVITALDGNNSYFFEILFKQTFMLQIFQRYSQGLTSDTWNLKFPTFSEIKCLVPCEDEQNKIVECVTVLDSVIEKQKATLAAWEELKKGLLQQMFV